MTAKPPRPPFETTEKLITFLYYVDLPRAMRFYEDVMGLKLEIDQGWSKIYRVTPNGYVGLVDETRGSHRANPIKPVQICMRVADVDAWAEYIKGQGIEILRGPRSNEELKIRAFIFNDPEGYQLEIQSALA
ncbi:MAG: VOC family protein [Beijerinckiaceae bacterium]|jgi:predicted enzyme related to lactoylglutathione lyase|nr:VOC family protein [Beijerinckiaceae bacterium]